VHPGDRKPSFENLLRLVVVLVWIIAFWTLVQRVDSVPLAARFLSPGYWWLPQLGAAILVLFFIALVYCEPIRTPRRGAALLVRTALMILPLLYLPTALGSTFSLESAKTRSVNFGGAYEEIGGRTGEQAASGAATSDSGDTPADVSLLTLNLQRDRYSGKRIRTLGIVYRDSSMPQDIFFCYRLVMWCCAADARPVAVLVEAPKASGLKGGEWVCVDGTFGVTDFKGRQIVRLRADRVQPEEAPKIPYLLDE